MRTKKLLVLTLVLLFTTAVYGHNPIPSCGIPVFQRALFLETTAGYPFRQLPNRGKRTIYISAHGTSAPLPVCGTVWVCCLGGSDCLGPFSLCAEEMLAVEIDERDWGVYIECEYHLVVDVWIDEMQAGRR